MKKPTLLQHFTSFVFRGLLASIPLFLSYLAIQFIYVMVDKKVRASVETWTGYEIIAPGLGIVLMLAILYFLWLLASNVVGRRLFRIVEGITSRIPILKTTYQVGKQVSMAFSLPEKQVFRKALLVEAFREGQWLIGFVTGEIEDPANHAKRIKVFIPTVPNPTSGFLLHVKPEDTIDPKWTIDEAMKAIISGGIIGPEAIGRTGIAQGQMDFGEKE